MLEVRTASGLALPSPGKLVGHAAVFDSPADLGEFVESVRPGAFTRSLRQPGAIMALYDHERRSILGRVSAGTLRLREDAKGLAFELDLPDTTVGRDLAVLVERGDVSGCSFGFVVPKGGDHWEQRNGKLVRELRTVDLREITITPDPAYADTTVAKRSMPTLRESDALQTHRLWFATL
ncbi:MAG: HK97 family phage prohead protease [Rubrivivax sp.]|nr:HK97 family phage prohead protease [Rubrivivax sp.]